MPSRQGPRLLVRLSSIHHPLNDVAQTISDFAVTHAVHLTLPLTPAATQQPAAAAAAAVSGVAGDPGVPMQQAQPGHATVPAAGGLQAAALGGQSRDMRYHMATVQLGSLARDVAASELLRGAGVEFVAVSAGGSMESASGSMVVTREGYLHLAVPRATYEVLGLLGKKSTSGELFHISINLRGKSFKPGRGFYDRAIERLNVALPAMPIICLLERDGTPLHVPFLCMAEAAASSSGPVGNAAGVKLQDPLRSLCASYAAGTTRGLLVPPLQRERLQRAMECGRAGNKGAAGGGGAARGEATGRGHGGAAGDGSEAGAMDWAGAAAGGDVAGVDGMEGVVEASGSQQQQQMWQPECLGNGGGEELRKIDGMEDAPELLRELHEWLGALACGLDARACGSLVPEQLLAQCQAADVEQHRYRGLISAARVSALLGQARCAVDSGAVPWACLTCWGLPHCPIAWAGHEHEVHRYGHASEGQYSVLVLPGGGTCTFRALGAHEVKL